MNKLHARHQEEQVAPVSSGTATHLLQQLAGSPEACSALSSQGGGQTVQPCHGEVSRGPQGIQHVAGVLLIKEFGDTNCRSGVVCTARFAGVADIWSKTEYFGINQRFCSGQNECNWGVRTNFKPKFVLLATAAPQCEDL